MNPFEGWRITSPYGERIHPKTKVKGFHTGIDLANYDKCPIPSFYGGEVVYAGNGRSGTGFGNMGNVVAIYVMTPRGRADLHVYLHLHTVGVKVGQIVKQGQIIGTQGNTGAYSMGSHLHFEIRKRASKGIPFGWTKQNDPDMCYEPTQYLIDLYEEEEKLQKQIGELKNLVEAQGKEIKKLKDKQSMIVPEWAKDAVNAAIKAGLVDTPDGGSYDFYRVLTILHRAGKL